jgi:hypothetical protein
VIGQVFWQLPSKISNGLEHPSNSLQKGVLPTRPLSANGKPHNVLPRANILDWGFCLSKGLMGGQGRKKKKVKKKQGQKTPPRGGRDGQGVK